MKFNADLSILVAEDDELDVMNIKRTFKRHGIVNPLHIAKDGVEAWGRLKGEDGYEKITPTPKIILLDVNMPRMNGFELLRKIREDDELKSMLAFVLTTSTNDNDVTEAYSLNVAGYILKPMEFEKFVEAINSFKVFISLIEYTRTE